MQAVQPSLLVGTVGAGTVVEFPPRHDALTLPVFTTKTGRKLATVAYKVEGDSLEPEIVSGEYIICVSDFELEQIEDGDVCVVEILATGETVAKKVVRCTCNGMVLLKSTNDAYPDRAFAQEEVEIKHIVIGTYRRRKCEIS